MDSHNEGKERPEDAEGRTGDAEVGLDIDETLQDELCELWDMSMNSVRLPSLSIGRFGNKQCGRRPEYSRRYLSAPVSAVVKCVA